MKDKSPADGPWVQTGDITAGRDVNFGLTPEQVKELTEAAARGATGPLTSAIVDLSKRLGITEDATRTLLRIVGEQDVPLERLSETLYRVANDYKRLREQAAALNPDNPTAEALVEQAKPEIEAGHLGRARELLRQATQAQIAAAQQAYQIQEHARAAGDAQMLGAAQSTAAEANVAMTELRYLEAAELFGQAASYVPGGHASETGGYLLRQADALYRQGDQRGDNDALKNSIEVYSARARGISQVGRLRSTGRGHRVISAMRSGRSAIGRAGRRGSRRRSRPFARRCRN